MRTFSDPKEILSRTSLVDSFLEFVQIDTQSDAAETGTPSTAKQFDLLKVLKKKLVRLECKEVRLDDKGYLYAYIPGATADAPAIGLMAHVDTAMDFSGAGVTPILHRDYKGGPIVLPGDVIIAPEDDPELAECVGDTIITASGNTLLGADDKAGVAEILAVIEILKAEPDIAHPPLCIAFTPDEEIGRGPDFFDIKGFGATAAYTVDGGFAGEVNFETFSADKAVVTFTGVAVHPGTAKGKMVNALRFLGRFLDSLPRSESPEATELREGFFHPTIVQGNAAEASTEILLREFDNGRLEDRGKRLQELVSRIAAEEPRLKTKVEIVRQYRNMANALKDHSRIREQLLQAVRDAGMEPKIMPIRGGTDGSGLTAMGLPTPNIFTGGKNAHGPREWISDRVMALAVCTMLNLVQRLAE